MKFNKSIFLLLITIFAVLASFVIDSPAFTGGVIYNFRFALYQQHSSTCLHPCFSAQIINPALASNNDEIFKSSVPEEGSTVTEPAAILIHFIKDITPQDYLVFLNGKNITSKCRFSQGVLKYHPVYPYKPGRNEFNIKVKANEVNYNYKLVFYYVPYSPIKEITLDSSRIYYENDQLSVQVKALPGGEAVFYIENVKDNIIMQETEQGLYQGIYDIASSDITSSAKIKCKIKYPDGKTFEKLSNNGVILMGSFFVVRFISPKPGDKVGQSFDIIGKTRAGATVKVSAKYSLENIPIVGHVKTETGGFEAKADSNGEFKLNFGLPVKVTNMKITLCATAKDEEGNEAIPTMSVIYVE